jgi:nicotinamide riboside transporter PnuC
MNDVLVWIGRVAGVSGVLLCAVAAVARISGNYFFGSFQVGTLLQAGMAMMIGGCLGYLAALTGRS